MKRSRSVSRSSSAKPPVKVPAAGVGAFAAGAIAGGVLVLGAIAIGSVAIGALAVRRSKFGTVEIDDLTVRHLKVIEKN